MFRRKEVQGMLFAVFGMGMLVGCLISSQLLCCLLGVIVLCTGFFLMCKTCR